MLNDSTPKVNRGKNIRSRLLIFSLQLLTVLAACFLAGCRIFTIE